MTPLGLAFAEAGILARKDIFASRARRLPMLRWLLSMLRTADNHQLKWNMVETALSLEFPPDEIEGQINTLINWGRYGELLSYEDGSELITLEQEKARQP